MGGKNKLTTSANHKAAHKNYKEQNHHFKNKVRKMVRHCTKYPDDIQSERQLDKIVKAGANDLNYSSGRKALGHTPPKQKRFFVPTENAAKSQTVAEQLHAITGRPLPRKRFKKRK